MMHKIADLSGGPLDTAVALAEGWRPIIEPLAHFWRSGSPSADWSIGGPLIERGGVALEPVILAGTGECWRASVWGGKCHAEWVPEPFYGATPLIAAMRAYVASKFSAEVDLPDEVTSPAMAPRNLRHGWIIANPAGDRFYRAGMSEKFRWIDDPKDALFIEGHGHKAAKDRADDLARDLDASEMLLGCHAVAATVPVY